MTRTPSPQPSPPDRWRSEREEMERLMRQRSGGEGAKISSTGMGASSSPPHLLIRADASESIGVGHVMRMIALAQAWQKRGGTVAVASCHCPEPVVDRLQLEHIQFTKLTCAQPGDTEDAAATTELAVGANSAAVVLDGYEFDARYQALLHQQLRPLLVVDDCCHCDGYHCDLILNQNLGASREMYASIGAAAKVLPGPQYALLRDEFLGHGEFERDVSQVRRLLVTLGGSSIGELASTIADAFKLIEHLELEIRVLAGGNACGWKKLQSLTKHQTGISILPPVADMGDQYRWADVAIVGGGSSNWEMCLDGLPRLIVVLAENQREVALRLSESGAAVNLGCAKELSSEKLADSIQRLATDVELRARLASRSKSLVDGRGAKRVVDELMSAIVRVHEISFASEQLQIRPATLADSNLLYDWRNDPATRKASRNQDEITPDRHQQWLRETLSGNNRRLFIAETGQTPVGTIRLDFADEVEISWTVAPSVRGHGWGKKMVALVAESVNCDLVACVRTENNASRKIAEAAGFDPAGQQDDLLIYRRSSCS